jgi:hypothetical protein
VQYLSTFSPSASGKAGGHVASRGRIGSQLRAHFIPVQRLTASSSEARAITGGLPALWRNLTLAEQQSWFDLANTLPTRDRLGQPLTLSGYALYIACSRRLLTIGIQQPLTAAPEPPSIPAITGFGATLVYQTPGTQDALQDIQLTTASPLPTDFTPILRASAAVSATRSNIRASDLRIIEAGTVWPTQPHSVLTPWTAIFGAYPNAGTITFELSLVDPASGLIGAPIRARSAPALTIEVEGTPVAEIPWSYVEVEGTIVAN